jgi:membrane-associated phospholipid phosphatase
MKAAVGTPTLWQAQAAAATVRGEIAWASQESPTRPGMLANFGQVKAWTMTPAEVIAAEPPPPPSTSSQQMKDDLADVKNTVDHLTRDQVAIALKWNDGVGTPTPPGHWNAIASDYVRGARMSEVRAARAFALLNMAMHDVAVGCWDTKYRYYNPRPAQLDPSIKTFIGLPNFPSYPSGHSTFSSAAATTLAYLFPEGTTSFNTMAAEAGMSRLYGGIHYRSDITGGSDHGKRVGAAVVSYARADGSP